MSDRITQGDLEGALAAHEAVLRRFGMLDPTHRLGITSGSKLYGNSFTVYVIQPGSMAHHTAPVVGWLGMTKRDAYDALTAATGTVYRTMGLADSFPRKGDGRSFGGAA